MIIHTFKKKYKPLFKNEELLDIYSSDYISLIQKLKTIVDSDRGYILQKLEPLTTADHFILTIRQMGFMYSSYIFVISSDNNIIYFKKT